MILLLIYNLLLCYQGSRFNTLEMARWAWEFQLYKGVSLVKIMRIIIILNVYRLEMQTLFQRPQI